MDQEVQAEFYIDMQQRIYELNIMSVIKTKICLLTGPIASQQFYVVTDASNKATSALIYLRSTTTEGNVIENFVLDKCRVAPIKQTSISKHEL